MYIEEHSFPKYQSPEFDPTRRYVKSGSWTSEIEAERNRDNLQAEGKSAYYIKTKWNGKSAWSVYYN